MINEELLDKEIDKLLLIEIINNSQNKEEIDE